MAKIKLTEEKNEIYFKSTTQYELDVDGKPLTIRIEEDSNEGKLHYLYDWGWSETAPDWITELGENDWGELVFEEAIWSNVSGLDVNEEISTEDDE
jgi:hypothetical protein|tara:strand:- start:68 stop:355 length:288 start_codon:yes stop_codon:yes gene_type:complete